MTPRAGVISEAQSWGRRREIDQMDWLIADIDANGPGDTVEVGRSPSEWMTSTLSRGQPLDLPAGWKV